MVFHFVSRVSLLKHSSDMTLVLHVGQNKRGIQAGIAGTGLQF